MITDRIRLAPYRPRRNDCAIWTLASLLSRDYEEIIAAAAKVDRAAGLNGLYFTQMIRIAEGYGVTLIHKRRVNLAKDAGALGSYINGTHGHVNLLVGGRIVDMRGGAITITQAQKWIASKRATVAGILVEE